MSTPAECSCVRITRWVNLLSTMLWCVVVSGNHGAVIKSGTNYFPFLSHASSSSELPPRPSPTGVRVSSVTMLLMSCVSCSAMIMFSSYQDGWSSLLFAYRHGHHEVVKMLLSAGANIDLQDKVSTTSPSQGSMVIYALMGFCSVDLKDMCTPL